MTDMSQAPEHLPPGVVITSQIPQSKANVAGMFTPGMIVYFSTPSGVNSSVWIPSTSYNATTVKAAIEQAVNQIESVQALSNPTG